MSVDIRIIVGGGRVIYTNVVVGTPQIEPWELLAFDKQDWDENEKKQTLFTENRFLPAIMKEAGLVQSIKEVRRNKPELCRDVEGPDFMDIKWGKRHLFIMVEGELPEPPKTDRTIKEIWDTFSTYEKNLTYELVGQSLENGDYDREALVMFDDEKLEVVKALIDQTFLGK